MQSSHKKRGQSLVEVVVALGIIGVIFTNIVVLIVYGFNLANASRNKTEAIAIAQQKMSESIILIQHNCPLNNINGASSSLADDTYANSLEAIIQNKIGVPQDNFTVVVDVRKPDTPLETGTGDTAIDRNLFYYINIQIKWADKGITANAVYSLDQLIKIN
ncbi:MAG: type II secretion system protein [bacterium]